jgi:hypothetical protein
MPEQMQQQALMKLEQAAAAAAEAAGIMSKHAAAATTPHQQPQDILRSLRLLQQATSVRRQLLHPHNQLLGASCHQAAVAAVAAVTTAASATITCAQSLLLLQHSLEVSTAAEVSSLVKAVKQQLAILVQCGLCACCSCSSSSQLPGWGADSFSTAAAAAAATAATDVQRPVPVQTRQQQLQLCEELQQVLQQTCSCKETASAAAAAAEGSCGPGLQLQLHKLVLVALQNLQGSVLAAAANAPPDALGTAAEQLVAVAAVAALLECEKSVVNIRQMNNIASAAAEAEAVVYSGQNSSDRMVRKHNDKWQQQLGGGGVVLGQQTTGSGAWCCRCSRLLRTALAWAKQAEMVISVHIGAYACSV